MKADDTIKHKGDVIHAGQGHPHNRVLRIANMGMLFTQDIEGLLAAFQKVLESAAVRA